MEDQEEEERQFFISEEELTEEEENNHNTIFPRSNQKRALEVRRLRKKKMTNVRESRKLEGSRSGLAMTMMKVPSISLMMEKTIIKRKKMVLKKP